MTMRIAFKLSMPGVNSWDNRWSGEAKRYVIVRSTKRDDIAGNSYGYNFGDGWYACVRAEEVTANEAAMLRRKSDGFCGYEWMVDSIIIHGEIRP